MDKFKQFFGAGCNARPAVKPASPFRECGGQIRRDSGADSESLDGRRTGLHMKHPRAHILPVSTT